MHRYFNFENRAIAGDLEMFVDMGRQQDRA